MENRKTTALVNAAWDVARESLRASLKVTDFQLAKLDGSAFAFRYTNDDGTQTCYVLYKTWVPQEKKLPYATACHLLFNAYLTINQIPNERDNVTVLSYKNFYNTGKVKDWPEGILVLH